MIFSCHSLLSQKRPPIIGDLISILVLFFIGSVAIDYLPIEVLRRHKPRPSKATANINKEEGAGTGVGTLTVGIGL